MIKNIKKRMIFVLLMLLSLFVNLLIKILPFKKILSIVSNSYSVDENKLKKDEIYRLKRLVTIIEDVEEFSPWRVKCYEQSIIILLAARLFRISINVYFGVKKDGDNIKAHSWTTSGSYYITGGKNARDYTKVLQRAYDADKNSK